MSSGTLCIVFLIELSLSFLGNRTLQGFPFIARFLSYEEISAVYMTMKEEQLKQQYWGRLNSNIVPEKVDGHSSCYDVFKIDFEQFRWYFMQFFPWISDSTEFLVIRIFAFLDENNDNFVNLFGLLVSMIVFIKADIEVRLRFLFAVHMCDNVARSPSLLSRADSISVSAKEVEAASEATEFFDTALESPSEKADVSDGGKSTIPNSPLIESKPKKFTLSNLLYLLNPPSSQRANYLQSLSQQSNSSDIEEAFFKKMPAMKEIQFISLWKTLYDIFANQTNEQVIFDSIATIGNNLLRLGYLNASRETREKELTKSDDSSNATLNEEDTVKLDSYSIQSFSSCSSELVDNEEASTSHRNLSYVNSLESDWEISFEQFYSILHTEQTLVDLFEKKVEWESVLSKFKNIDKLERTMSLGAGAHSA